MNNLDQIPILKKGGIHIKKKNRGSFTHWCNGKVTEECIRRGKNSSNPAIRKKATFAANARRWKHENGGPLRRPNFKKSKEAYYDPETDTVFAPDSLGEFYHHEMFHARPNLQLLESLKPYYHNLNDDVLKQMGADLSFVKRFNNDPGYFYSPEELGARVVSASEMLNRMGVKDVTLDFLKNARLNENAYGDNFRDLIHMYNDENLIKIFNAVKKHENSGIIKTINNMVPDIIRFFNGGGIPMFQNSGKINWRNKTGYIEDPYTNRVGSTSQYSYGDVQKDENGFTYRDSRLQFNTPTGEVETNYVRKYKPNRRYKRYVKKYGHPVEPHVWTNHYSDGTTSTDTLGYTPEQIDSLTTYFNTFGSL